MAQLGYGSLGATAGWRTVRHCKSDQHNNNKMHPTVLRVPLQLLLLLLLPPREENSQSPNVHRPRVNALMRRTRARHQPLGMLQPLQRYGECLRAPQLRRTKSLPLTLHNPTKLRRQLLGRPFRQQLHKLRNPHRLHHPLLFHLLQPHSLRPLLQHLVGM
jgi:hypothetical protein